MNSDFKLYGYTLEELERMADTFEYNPINWVNRRVERPNVWKHTDLGNNDAHHGRADGFVFEKGTKRGAETFGPMDLGIFLNRLNIKDILVRLGSAELEIKNLHNAMFNNETSNTFRTDFIKVGEEYGITITGGWYDEVRKEVVW